MALPPRADVHSEVIALLAMLSTARRQLVELVARIPPGATRTALAAQSAPLQAVITAVDNVLPAD